MVDPVQEYCTEEAYYIELNGKLEKQIQSLTKKLERCKEVIEYYSEGMAHVDYDHYSIQMDKGHIAMSSGKRARLILKEIWGDE